MDAEAVGAVGTPVSAGDARGAFNAKSPRSTFESGIVRVLVVLLLIPERPNASFFVAVLESLNTGAVIVGALVPAFAAMLEVFVAISPKSTSVSGIVSVLVLFAVIPARPKSSFFVAVVESLNTGAVIVGALVPAFAAMFVVFVEMFEVFVETLLVFVEMFEVFVEILLVFVAISAKSTSASAIVTVLVFEAVIPVRSKSSFFDAVAESLNTGAVIVGALVPAFAAMFVVFVEMFDVFVEMLLVFVAMPPRVVSTSENPGIATVP